MECGWCGEKFTKKSNLDRHVYNKHDNKSFHNHGLQYVDKKYIKRDTECFLHGGCIKDGKMFHCLHVTSVSVQTVWRKIVKYVIKIFVIIRRY